MLFVQENVGQPIAMEKAFSATLPYDDCNAVFAIMVRCNHGVDSSICFLECKISFLWLCGYRAVIDSKTPSIIRDAIALEDFQWTTEHEIEVLQWL